MNERDAGATHLGLPENPFAPPTADAARVPSKSEIRLRAVTRIYRIIGWFGIVLYVPIVLTCAGSLIGILPLMFPTESRLSLAGPLVFHSIFLALAVLYVLTARRIAARDFTVRRRAAALSFLMMIGFPIFTIVGIVCYRYLRLHFSDQGEAVENAGANA